MSAPAPVSVLVSGATGNVGRHVARVLLERGAAVTAASSKPSRAASTAGTGARGVRLDFLDRSSWEGALAGARRLFLMRPPAIARIDETLGPFIDLALERGVEQIVFLSVAGAGKNRLVPHRAAEDHLRERGAPHTNLRPGFFAQNLGAAYRRDIAEDDRIYVPAGRTQPVNWIDTRDIAEAAALILLDPKPHRGENYTLCGPGAVPWSRVSAALSRALGRPIRYEPASVIGYAAHLARRGLSPGQIAIQTALHVGLRFGQGAGTDPTLERLLGRPGRPIEEYVDDHAALWEKPEGATDPPSPHERSETR